MSEKDAYRGVSDRSDPHENDYCVVCLKGVRRGVTMHPVAGIENGCICEECSNAGRSCDNEDHSHIDAFVIYEDGSAWCEDCHEANLAAAGGPS